MISIDDLGSLKPRLKMGRQGSLLNGFRSKIREQLKVC